MNTKEKILNKIPSSEIFYLILIIILITAIPFVHSNAYQKGFDEGKKMYSPHSFDSCLSRYSEDNWKGSNWVSSHYKLCHNTLMMCRNDKDCLVKYEGRQGEFKRFRINDTGIIPSSGYISDMQFLVEHGVPGGIEYTTSYGKNGSTWNEGSVGWKMWKNSVEKEKRIKYLIELEKKNRSAYYDEVLK